MVHPFISFNHLHDSLNRKTTGSWHIFCVWTRGRPYPVLIRSKTNSFLTVLVQRTIQLWFTNRTMKFLYRPLCYFVTLRYIISASTFFCPETVVDTIHLWTEGDTRKRRRGRVGDSDLRVDVPPGIIVSETQVVVITSESSVVFRVQGE